jgi:hypothetical protein
MLSRSIYAALFSILAAGVVVPLADSQVQGRILSFADTEVSQAVVQIEEYFGVKILTDGRLDKKVTATLREPDIAQALTSVTSPFGYKWRKVTLAVKPQENVSGATLRSIVSALEKLDAAGAVVDNPVESTRLAFRRNPEDSEDLASQTLPTGEVYKTYYFVYSAKPKITFTPATQAKTGAVPGQPGQPAAGGMSTQGIADWFSTLDRETQSELVGQLIGSMMESGDGDVAFWFNSGDEQSGAVRQGRIVIRRDESGVQGEGQ